MAVHPGVVHLNRGIAHGNAGRHVETAADFERAVAVLRPLVQAHPDIPAWRDTLEQAEQSLAWARRLAAATRPGEARYLATRHDKNRTSRQDTKAPREE